MTDNEIRLAAIAEAALRHSDAVMADPEKGRITGKKQKRAQADNTAGNVLTFMDNGLNRRFVISVNVTSIDPTWKPSHPKDIAPDNGCEEQLAAYQAVIKKFLNELHDHIDIN